MTVVDLKARRFPQMEDAVVVDFAAYLERRFREDEERRKAIAGHPAGKSARFQRDGGDGAA
jgi:hypothetical protein